MPSLAKPSIPRASLAQSARTLIYYRTPPSGNDSDDERRMIHYQLRCDAAHGFDGWFASGASFDSQATRGLLECPVCGSSKVERGLMTPAVPKKGRGARQIAVPTTQVAANHVPDGVRAMLQKLRAEVERNCDYVGDTFADEARRIHNGESDARAIYGESTQDEAKALADDGIAVSRIPWVPRADG